MEKNKIFRKPVNVKKKLIYTLIYAAIIFMMSVFKIPCIFIRNFGIPCPGCGMTRALKAALVFDFEKAFSYHWMVWTLPIMYIYFIWEGQLFEKKWIDAVIWCIIGAGFLINWLYRLSIFV